MEKSILSYDQSATFDSPSQSFKFFEKIFFCQKKSFFARKKVDNIWTIYILRAQGGEIGNSRARSSVSEY